MYGQTQPHTQYKVCVDENKFANFVKEEFSPEIFCKSSSAVSKKKSSKAELILTVRSTNSVFEFLGQVVAAQNQPKPYMVTLPPSESTYARKVGQENQYALLVVRKNDSSSKSFASVKNLDGNVYSIPSEGNGYSPLAGADDGYYVPDSTWSGDFYDPSYTADDCCMDDDEFEEMQNRPRSIVLYPVN